jgi:hypothetical protein
MRGSEVLEVERAQYIIDVFPLMQGESARLASRRNSMPKYQVRGPEVWSSNREERAFKGEQSVVVTPRRLYHQRRSR